MHPFLSILIPDLFFILFFYLNFYYLVPNFFIKKRYLLFSLICVGCLILTVAVPSLFSDFSGARSPSREFSEGMPHEFFEPPDDFPGIREIPPRMTFFRPEFGYLIFVFILIFTLSVGIRMVIQWQVVEKEKVKAELAFLKAQINPHFLFNTLNNIYSMAINKREKTADAIEMFSEIMRFVILETQNDFVPLTKKIKYLRNYIALQDMRLPSNVHVNFNLKGNASPYKIAPLILMPFIENAFKYGISTEKESTISINIEIIDGGLHLLVRNMKFSHSKTLKETTPLGIENTIKRLELIYPGKHKINIVNDTDIYQVSLYLDLNDQLYCH